MPKPHRPRTEYRRVQDQLSDNNGLSLKTGENRPIETQGKFPGFENALLRWWHRVPPGHPLELYITPPGIEPEEDTGLRFAPRVGGAA
jgi:hypothetical protein